MSDELLRIAFDAMGGYHAPEAPVQAAVEASLSQPFHSILVGDTARIEELLSGMEHDPERLSVVHASKGLPPDRRTVTAEESEDTSLAKAARILASRRADALVTAANGGPTIMAMRQHLPMLKGIERAAIAAVVPTQRRRGEKQDPFSLFLDVGATDYATAHELVTFAIMGAAYARCISKNPCPRVALLSNSREPSASPESVAHAHKILTAMSDDEHFTFIGNVEGNQLPTGVADVVVCEGYTGNVVIRLVEGIADTAVALARAAFDESLRARLGLSMLSGKLEQLRKLTDWEEYGGAPLLGFSRPVMVTHAGSGKRALLNAAKVAARTVREDVMARIEDNLR